MNTDSDSIHPRRKFKRYCKTLDLRNDPLLIAEYREAHAPGAVWPEITGGMREVGILGMEIYIYQTRLFMIMDTIPDFDHERAMTELAGKPRQSEWEAHMSRFQDASPGSTADQKWQVMERIFTLKEPFGGD
jgi:L-rhamnose mutarotase